MVAWRGGVGDQPIRGVVDVSLVAVHVHHHVPQRLHLLPGGRALHADRHDRVAGPQHAHVGDVGQQGSDPGRFHAPEIALSVQNSRGRLGGVGGVVGHLLAREELDRGEVVGLAVCAVVRLLRAHTTVATVGSDDGGLMCIVLAMVLDVVRVPEVQRRQEDQLQGDGIRQPLDVGFADAGSARSVAMRHLHGSDARLGVFRHVHVAIGEASVANSVAHSVVLAHLPAAVVVGHVDWHLLQHLQLRQAKSTVDYVSPVVVLARNLVHQVVQQVPLVPVVGGLLVHHVADHAGVEVLVEVSFGRHAVAKTLQWREVGDVHLGFERVAHDAVVPLRELRHAVADVVDGGGQVGEVLRVDAVSCEGCVVDLLLKVTHICRTMYRQPSRWPNG